MSSKQYLAVDLGAESGRTVVASSDGSKLALQETHRFPNNPVRLIDTLHWDVLHLWQEIKAGIAKSVRQSGNPACLGVDTWGVDFGLLDADGGLLANPVHYRDRRTDGIFDFAFQALPQREIYRITGLQFLKFNSLFQLLALRRQASCDPFGGVDKLLFMPDLFNYFLTGRKGAEYTIASTSQMLDARSRQWSGELLGKFDLPTHFLPELIDTGSSLGSLLPSVAEETGARGTQVIATAGHDTAAAVVAVPATKGNVCYISSGTWSLMGTELSEPAITERGLADNFTNEGGVAGTIRFLKNIMGLWLVQECRRSFLRKGQSLEYADMVRQAEAAKPFTAIFDPDHAGFIKPDDMPTAIREFCREHGQDVPDDVGSLARSCLESLALCYRKTLEQLEANIGHRLEVIHIVGGGCQNEFLCQLTADCCQREVIAGPIEATAMGNALVQMLATGEIKTLADARQIVRSSFTVKSYAPRKDKRWDDQYQVFLKLLSTK
ncbi:MAG: rhamnulokinase family protein [Planctomycetota bacterium]